MYKNTKEPICDKCSGYEFVEVYNHELGFEVYELCPKCQKDISLTLVEYSLGGLNVSDETESRYNNN